MGNGGVRQWDTLPPQLHVMEAVDQALVTCYSRQQWEGIIEKRERTVQSNPNAASTLVSVDDRATNAPLAVTEAISDRTP